MTMGNKIPFAEENTPELRGTFFSLDAKYFNPRTRPHFDYQWGAPAVFCYEDVVRVFEDPEAFSKHVMETDDPHPSERFMWNADAPRSTDFQNLLREPFHRHWQKLEDSGGIRATASQQLARSLAHAPHGELDLVDFARHFTFRVACALIGVSEAHVTEHLDFLDQYLWPQGVKQIAGQPSMVTYFHEVLEERKRHPGQGLIDELIDAWQQGYPIAGEPITEQELQATMWALLVDTADAAATSIGNATLALIAWGCWEQLRADRSLLHTAFAETVRWNPAFPVEWALTKRAVHFGDYEIPPGQIVMAWISAANRSESCVNDPQRFDITRASNPHLGFGRGLHTCMGAPLAKAEAFHALSLLLDQFPTLEVDSSKPLPRYLFRANNSLLEAHVRLRAQLSEGDTR